MRKIPDQVFSYSEDILQGVWQKLLFNATALKTSCGKSLKILNPGRLNPTDGPDFKGAALLVENIQWHGDVEIHIRSKDWNRHGHQHDPNFNQVILHVVAEEHPLPVQSPDGNQPFTLNLLPFLHDGLHHFIKHRHHKSLPCTRVFKKHDPKSVNKQILRAHREYLDRKVQDFLLFYDAKSPTEKAWKQALVISLFDGMGIPHNRRPMQRLARELLERDEVVRLSPEALLGKAGVDKALSSFNWNYKSVRPSSHPRKRVPEAGRLGREVLSRNTDFFAGMPAGQSWNMILDAAGLRTNRIFRVLFGTVYLPSLYVLGNFLMRKNLSKQVFKTWMNLRSPVPESTVTRLKDLTGKDSLIPHKLGSVYQLRHYCDKGRCFDCFVLKNAIQS